MAKRRSHRAGSSRNRAGTGIVIHGVDRVIATLDKIKEDIVLRAMDDAAKDTANAIMFEAKRLVPVRTGKLRSSIHVKKGHVTKSVADVLKSPKSYSRGMVAKAKRIKDTSYAVICGSGMFLGETYYSGMVEFGTKRMAARPFMRPAAASKKDLMRKLFRHNIQKIVQNSARRRANQAISGLEIGIE